MNIEDRLRAELERTSRTTTIEPAPSVDQLALVAAGRQRRNRLAGIGAGALIVGGLALGAVSLSSSGDSTVELAGTEETEVTEVADAEPVEANESSPSEEASGEVVETPTVEETEAVEPVEAEGADSADEAVSSAAAGDSDPDASEQPSDDANVAIDDVDVVAAFGAAQLQADDIEMTVESRESAVGLASGSGVLLVPANGGYVGVAAAFGNETTAIGLSSNNGLDWSSSVLSGVPAGATASVLDQHGGVFVALFERFNADTATRETYVATSADAVGWDATLLPGGQVFATDLAVGPNGVVVIGDNDDPAIWTGPIGGPYERTATLEATALSGITTVGDRFLVAGRNADGLALFTSNDGVEWDATGLGSTGDGRTLSVSNGTVSLHSIDDGTADTLISSDGGVTWTALPAAASRGVSASASTVGFLGEASGPVVSVADADSFSTVQIDVSAPDRLALVSSDTDEIVMVQTTEAGTTWIVARR